MTEKPPRKRTWIACKVQGQDTKQIEIKYSQYLLLIGEVQRINKYQGQGQGSCGTNFFVSDTGKNGSNLWDKKN